jgi:hypothetical protein
MNSPASFDEVLQKTLKPWHPSAALVPDRDFPYGLFFAVVLVVVAGHCFFGEMYHLAERLIPSWALSILAFVALFYSALVLHAERLKPSLPLLPIAVAGLSVFFIGTHIHHALAEFHWGFPLVMISAAAFALALKLAHTLRHELERGRSLDRTRAEDYVRQKAPVQALILAVSRPDDSKRGIDVTIFSDGPVHARFVAGEKWVELERSDFAEPDVLNTHIKRLSTVRPNWQQLLRAVEPHSGKLKAVTLYGSALSRVDECARFLRPYLKGVDLKVFPPVELEEFEEVHTLLKGEVERLLAAGHRPEGIAIDITGGFKVPSVTGAVLTLNRAVVCQYVPSVGSKHDEGDDMKPFIYDFRWDKSLELPA